MPALHLAPVPDQGDLDFEAFVRTYELRLRRLVMRRIGDLCEAEEITQETLLRAYQHRMSFSSEDELMAWSTVVAQRLVIDRVRVRGRSVAVAEVPENARLGRDTADVVVARHEARAALESLEAIPTRQAAILWAREVEGLHYEEIAERFGITEPAVRSLLHRGRRALRKEFKDRTGSLPLNGLVPFAPWLLALKAAGKVRGVAKTLAKSSTTVAALSLSLIVAGGIASLAPGHARHTDVKINTAPGGATLVQRLADPVAVVANRPDLGGTYRGGALTAPTTAGHTRQPLVCATMCVTPVPPGTPMDTFKGAVITVGVDLPDNPADMKNIFVNSDRIDCADTPLPSDGLVSCTQYGPSHRSPVRSLPTPGTEGALR
jgi:RNA polymerase sigma-70 factor (ECF subfamily)